MDDPAAYWQPSDGLGTSSEDNAELRYAVGQPLIYLRIWPREKIAPLTSLTLNNYQKSVIEPLCGTPDGWSHVRNRFGTLAYSHSRGNGQLHASTQVLKTGEIWGGNHYLLRERPEREHYSKFVPTGAFETRLRTSLNKYLSVATTHLGYPPKIMVESGLVNVDDYRLALPDRLFDEFSEPIFENVRVTSEITMEEPETIIQALLRIFEAVYEARYCKAEGSRRFASEELSLLRRTGVAILLDRTASNPLRATRDSRFLPSRFHGPRANCPNSCGVLGGDLRRRYNSLNREAPVLGQARI